jgi:hypothetical protein
MQNLASKNKISLTDEQLFNLCKNYGENARHWRQKFAGLLPEVYKRRLYEQKGFSSIFEFAAKLSGMSNEQVRRVLSLERKFEDMPTLHSLLINGEVGANKLVRIASIATTQNQEVLARLTENLSNRAIETFVKDEKRALNEEANPDHDYKSLNGLQEPLFSCKYVHVHASAPSSLEIVKLKLDEDVLKELLELQGKNIDINNLIRKMLNERKAEIASKKEKIREESEIARVKEMVAREQHDAANEQAVQGAAAVKKTNYPSRYIPAKIRKIINEEQGDICSVPGCSKKAEVTHHELPFAITRTHDPNYLKKLCKAHHELRHMINIKFYEHARHTWSEAECAYKKVRQ